MIRLFSSLYRIFVLPLTRKHQVPPQSYTPSPDFVKKVLQTLSVGSVSLCAGRIFTKENHDDLWERVKHHDFTSKEKR